METAIWTANFMICVYTAYLSFQMDQHRREKERRRSAPAPARISPAAPIRKSKPVLSKRTTRNSNKDTDWRSLIVLVALWIEEVGQLSHTNPDRW